MFCILLFANKKDGKIADLLATEFCEYCQSQCQNSLTAAPETFYYISKLKFPFGYAAIRGSHHRALLLQMSAALAERVQLRKDWIWADTDPLKYAWTGLGHL